MKCKNSTFLRPAGGNRIARNARITAFLLALFVSSLVVETAMAQPLLPPIKLEKTTIKDVFSAIENKSDYVFLMSGDIDAELQKQISINTSSNRPTNEIMDQIVGNTNLKYVVSGNQITVFSDNTTRNAQQPQNITVSGIIRDSDGNVVIGAAVILQSNTSRGVISDAQGRYSITVPAEGSVLIFKFIGMGDQSATITPGVTTYNVIMPAGNIIVKEVTVSTGIFTRNSATFTGDISSHDGETLRNINSRSPLEALAVLDPSFIMIENVTAGSNPNSMKSPEIRGQGTASLNSVRDEFSQDPNQPLFILDGVQVSYSRIHNLNSNRIQTINLLKDAGATAIYGSQGANGVVVIETIKPVAGEYRIDYNGSLTLSGPDLSVYNMMNSREKLEFERLSGKFVRNASAQDMDGAIINHNLSELYNHFFDEIANGVDTYWMSEPVRTAISHTHSVNVSGGTEQLAITAGIDMNMIQGVMKNNDRDTWAGNISLRYRSGKVIIHNTTDISGVNSTESNYGSFSKWVEASPYFRKYNEDGGIDKWLMTKYGLGATGTAADYGNAFSSITNDIPNPLWDATKKSYNKGEELEAQNNFKITYNITDYLKATGSFVIRTRRNQATIFVDAEDTSFENIEEKKKGTYKHANRSDDYWAAEFNLDYGQLLNQVHLLNANAYFQISEARGESLTTEASGFSPGSDGSPHMAQSYKADSKPSFAWTKSRRVGMMFSFNYAYDLRYLFDATFRLDGSTSFGSNKLYKPFWSLGLGWNINRERFAANWDWLDQWTLKASLGTTGNQSMGKIASKSIYQYFIDTNVFGKGLYLNTLGAPNLPWQVNQKLNLKMDLRMFNGRVSLSGSVYREVTKPQILNVAQIPSTGMSSYPMAMGNLTNKGVDFSITGVPIDNRSRGIRWSITLTGTAMKDKYDGFDKRVEKMNEVMRERSEFEQYRDGNSQNDLWGVKSYGIDPATGREIFMKKDGTLTFLYSTDDWIKIGNSRPTLQGFINTNFKYKNFTLGLALNYRFGADLYNSALYNKVENISKASLEKNQDKRALYNRWKNPGDISSFRAIQILTDDLPLTSRFIQRDNVLQATSISAGYEMINNPWLMRNLSINNMKITFTMNELFRLGTTKWERGTNSPFARDFTLGLSMSF